jgi:hypothetical protein
MLVVGAVTASSSAPARADESRPLLVSVDDLPVASRELHRTAAERLRITRGLLDVMQKHHIHAVGLVIGKSLEGPADFELLDMWLRAGHELGNHSFGHLDYSSTDSTAYRADVERGRKRLSEFLQPRGQHVRFFRFPYLREGDTPEKLHTMRDYLRQSGQRSLPVTIDDQDWSFERDWVQAREKGDQAALRHIGAEYQRALRLEVEDQEELGDRLFGRRVPQILLLHANEVGSAQWDALFGWLEETGHRFATADEVLADSAFVKPPDYIGTHGPGLWDRFLDVRRRAEAQEGVEKLLREQAASWNRGDLDAFTSVYAEDATFLAPSGVTHGRQAVLDRYRKRYPDRAAMGALSFEVLEVRLAAGTEGSILGDARPSHVHGVSVAARWTLDFPGKASASGLTLLVLRPRHAGSAGAGTWEIVQDASM